MKAKIKIKYEFFLHTQHLMFHLNKVKVMIKKKKKFGV